MGGENGGEWGQVGVRLAPHGSRPVSSVECSACSLRCRAETAACVIMVVVMIFRCWPCIARKVVRKEKGEGEASWGSHAIRKHACTRVSCGARGCGPFQASP